MSQSSRVGLFSLLSMTLLLFQNCGGNFKSQPEFSHQSSQGDFIQSAKFECQYIGADTLKDRLSSFLHIEEEDVPVLRDNGSPSNQYRIASNLTSLGVADPKSGKFADYSCEMTKFKITTEVMIDACTQALNNDEVKESLFPNGETDYSQLFLDFVGRLPTQIETQILNDLAASLPAEKRAAALCSATAISFESLTRI